jgi:hypothetical protein
MRRILVLGSALVLTSVIGGSVWSKLYWGYLWRRPSVDYRLLEAIRVVSVGSVTSIQGTAGQWTFAPGKEETPQEAIAFCHSDPYYCSDRALVSLQHRGLPLPLRAALPEDLDALYGIAAAGPWVARPDPGYESPFLGGTAVVVDHPALGRLLHLELGRPPVANDHHVHYSLLLQRQADTWAVLSSNRYFFDVAGVEGAEWYVLALLVFIALTAVSALLMLTLWLARVLGRRPEGHLGPA